MSAPLCPMCGKPLAKDTLNIRFAEPRPRTRAEAQRLTNQHITSVHRYHVNADFISSANVWDGKTYASRYEPFCTLRCALAFAQAAHRAGYVIKSRKG
jgi:endogenous inhibitor of DNA gyrase (YacG/DUF329 family)